MSILGPILGAFWEPEAPLYSFWGGLEAFSAEKRGYQKRFIFRLPIFDTKYRKWPPKVKKVRTYFGTFFDPFSKMRRRGSQDPQNHSKMTSRACFFHRFRTLISFCLRLLRKFSLWLLSLTDRTLPRNRRQLRPSSGLQNTLTQNWRELRPSSDLQNSLSKNWRELRPSNGLHSSLPKKWRALRPSNGLQSSLSKKLRALRPSSDLQNNQPKEWSRYLSRRQCLQALFRQC